MDETFYTILMRKVIMGASSQAEEQLLFDWMDKDFSRIKTFSLVSITMSLDEPELWECMEEGISDKLNAEDSGITRKELLLLLKAFLDEIKRGGIG
jgi:hypothetical protein